MDVTIEEIYKKLPALIKVQGTTREHIEMMILLSLKTKALLYFGIFYDHEQKKLDVPNSIDFDLIKQTIYAFISMNYKKDIIGVDNKYLEIAKDYSRHIIVEEDPIDTFNHNALFILEITDMIEGVILDKPKEETNLILIDFKNKIRS